MTEKIGLIKNPLTIIAIFAGLAEVSGTLVLPFIAEANQLTFIYFLIAFPCLLVILFFVTLNFNNKVLYAPSDYKDESNYVKIFKYDYAEQKSISVKVNTNEQFKYLSEQINTISETINKNIIELPIESKITIDDAQDKLEKSKFEYTVILAPKSQIFIDIMEKKNINFKIYHDPKKGIREMTSHRSIWLGLNIPIEIAKEIIKTAILVFPEISYLYLSKTIEKEVPSYVNNQVFIGGATKTAINFGLKRIPKERFDEINSFTTNEQLHKFIYSFYDINKLDLSEVDIEME